MLRGLRELLLHVWQRVLDCKGANTEAFADEANDSARGTVSNSLSADLQSVRVDIHGSSELIVHAEKACGDWAVFVFLGLTPCKRKDKMEWHLENAGD